MAKHKEIINVFINRKKYELSDPVTTGRALKELAGIPLGDVLFLQGPHEDAVVPNDGAITLKNGDHLHSQPAADYGGPAAVVGAEPLTLGLGGGVEFLPQPDGWTFVVAPAFELPRAYQPSTVRMLIKLPPLFPEAQPDMFWVQPPVRAPAGIPRGAGPEQVLGETWQRFSWHLKAGAWIPGRSELRDFVRCIRGRFERGD